MQQNVQEAESQQKRGTQQSAEAPKTKARAGRLLASARDAVSNAAERVAERIGERQIPKVLDQRERVKGELRAIPQRIQKLANQADLVLELIDDYRSGAYREISWRSLAMAAAALLYSVSPGDVVPDFLPLVGSMDDALVIGLTMRMLRKDLERYCRFKGYAVEEYFD